MEIIVQGDKNIRSILSRTYDNDICYQYSQFVIRQEVEEGEILLNTVTGEVVLLSSVECSIVLNSSVENEEIISQLVKYGYMVPVDCEEDRNIEQLRQVLRTRRNQNKIINFYRIIYFFCSIQCDLYRL